MARSRNLASRATAYLLFFLLAASSTLAFDADFDFYPQAAQPCLLDSAKSSLCKGDTAIALNVCLCGNGGNFVTLSAKCLGQNDSDDVGSVYDTMSGACSHSGTPLKVNKNDFLNAAANASPSSSTSTSTSAAKTTTTTKTTSTTTSKTTTSPTSSSSTTSSPTSSSATSASSSTSSPSPTSPPPDGDKNNTGASKKLSTGATIGIAVGASVAGLAAIAGLALFLIRRRKRSNTSDESHPMLVREKYGSGGGATTFPPHDPSPSLGSGGFDNEAKSHYSSSSYGGGGVPPQQQQPQRYSELTNTRPDAQRQSYLSAWDAPNTAYTNPNANNGPYVGPYATPQGGAVELPSETQQPKPAQHVFELDSQEPVASPPPVYPPVQQQQQPHTAPVYRPYLPN